MRKSDVSLAAAALVAAAAWGGQNLLVNGDFEAAAFDRAVRNSDWSYAIDSGFSCPGWEMSATDRTGVAQPNTPWIANGFTCIGQKAALVQMGNRLSQTFSVPAAGRYRLTFDYFCRNGQHGLNATCYLVQGEAKTELGTFLPENPTPIKTFLKELDLVPGAYTLLIQQEEISNDRTNLYDNFQLVRLDDNLIQNGDFESATYGGNSGVWSYFDAADMSCPGWQVEPANRAGVSRAATWVDGGAAGKIGTKALYIQTRDGVGVTTASQTFTVTEPGAYSLSFIHLARPSHEGHPCDVELVQGETVYALGTFKTANTTTPVPFARSLQLAKGEYTLRFRQTAAASGDHANVVDDIAIRKIASGNLILNGDFEEGKVEANGGAWSYANGANFACANWAMAPVDRTGLAKSGSPWIAGNLLCTGQFGLLLQTNGGADAIAEQTVVVTTAGDYRLTFEYAGRPGYFGCSTVVELVKGEEVLELTSVTTASDQLVSAAAKATLEPGVYTFRLRGPQTTDDQANVVDNVVFASLEENLVRNGDFEDSSFDGTWKYAADGSFRLADWEVSPKNRVGLARPDGTWIPRGLTGIGSRMLYLQTANGSGDSVAGQTISVPEAGVYKLTFDTTARGRYTGGACTVEIEQNGTVTPLLNFIAYSTGFCTRQAHVALDAGEATLRFRKPASAKDTTVAVDNVRLARAVGTVCRWKGTVDGDVAKAANWSCVNAANEPVEMVPDATSAVYFAGNLALQVPPGTGLVCESLTFADASLTTDCDWRGLGSGVRIDGTLELNGHDLQVAGLSGPGAVQNVAASGELVKNGSFEDYAGELVNGYTYLRENKAVLADWSYTGSIVLMIANGTWGTSTPFASETMCMIQGAASVSQTVQVPADGDYVLQFTHCGRNNQARFLGLVIKTEIDGTVVDAVSSLDHHMWGHQATIPLTAGAHTLTFRGELGGPGAGDDPCSWIDGVSLRPAGAASATLTVETLPGMTVRNNDLLLAGSLTLVKDGAGTFVAARTQQTYRGGTRIAAGTLQAPTRSGGNTDVTYSAERGIVGFFEGGVTVAEGAAFDVAGNYDFYRLVTELAGGTLKNSGPDHAVDGGSLGRVRLTADATLDVAADSTIYARDFVDCSFQLGGFTLTANVAEGKTLRARETFAGGTLKLVGGGTLTVAKTLDARTADLVVADAGLVMDQPLSVRDYVPASARDANSGTAALNVYGAFKPASDKFYGCTLQNGATMDLSAVTSDWSTTSAFENGKQTVEFADGATILVALGSRKRVNGMRLFAWTEKPANIGQVKFRMSDGKGVLQAADDGVYYVNGLMILLR